MKSLIVTVLGVSLVGAGCSTDTETARVKSLASVSNQQSSTTTSTSALPATSPRPIAWYAGPIPVTPALGSRLAAILHSLRTEPVVAIVTVTDIRTAEGDSSGMHIKTGMATLRVDEFWKRAASQPEAIRVGLTYPKIAYQTTSTTNGNRRPGNGILLEVGDRILVSGRYLSNTVFPDYATEVDLIAESNPDQQGMLIRGDTAVGIYDGTSVPIQDLKDAAQGREPSANVNRSLLVPSSSTSSDSNLPD